MDEFQENAENWRDLLGSSPKTRGLTTALEPANGDGVLEYPAKPLNSNGAERDIRAHVTRRKISFGTRSESGLAAGDACLGALKTCNELGVSYWDYLRDRLEVSGAPNVPRLADLITQRAAT